MGGIKKISSYIPSLCITSNLIPRIRGERRFANYDEDSVTMALECALKMEGIDKIDEIYFLSSTPPFTGRSSASLIAQVLDLEDKVKAFDILATGRMIADIIAKLSKENNSLILISEKKRYEIDSPEFYSSGDGSIGLFISREDPKIEVIDSSSISYDSLDEWKGESEEYFKTSEGKASFEIRKKEIKNLIEGLLLRNSLKKEDIWRVIFDFSDARSSLEAGSICGFSKNQIHQPVLPSQIGFTGSVHQFLEFAYLIEKEEIPEGANILLSGTNGGIFGVLLRTGKGLKEAVSEGIEKNLKRRLEIKDITTFYKLTGYLPYEKVRPFSPVPLHYRDVEQCMKLKAQRCKKCRAIQYPWRYVCYNCDSQEFEIIDLSKRGKIYTFTKDYLNPVPIQPLVMAVVELDGGGRFYGQMTDLNPQDVNIGMDVRLTFRRLHEGGEFTNYFWKIIPDI